MKQIKLHYYLETIYELIAEWKNGKKDKESTTKLLEEMSKHSDSIARYNNKKLFKKSLNSKRKRWY